MSEEFAIQLIMHPFEPDLWEATKRSLFDEEHAGVLFLTGEEAYEDIVDMVATALGTSDLSTTYHDEKLYINYKGQLTLVSEEHTRGGLHQLVSSLNWIISGDYEVRYIKISPGGDAFYYMVLPYYLWRNLEKKCSEKRVDLAFMRLE